jgi:hypothetical protein
VKPLTGRTGIAARSWPLNSEGETTACTGKLPASSNVAGLFSVLIAFPNSASCRSDFLPRRHCGTEFERSGPVRTGLGVPVFERLPPQYPDWMVNVGGTVTARPVVVRGTKLMVIWTAVSLLASVCFFAGALSHPGTGTLWAGAVLWGATSVLAGLRVWIRHRVASAVRGRAAGEAPRVASPAWAED